LMAIPRYLLLGLPLAVGMSLNLALQSSYSADMASFLNTSTAVVIGSLTGVAVTQLMRVIGAETGARRLLRAGWRDLADLAAQSFTPTRAEWASRMLDRVGLLMPRLSRAGRDPELRARVVAGDGQPARARVRMLEPGRGRRGIRACRRRRVRRAQGAVGRLLGAALCAAPRSGRRARRSVRSALIEAEVVLAGRTLTLLRPPSAEELIDEQAFAVEEFLPYWAELWPSGVGLAEHVATLDVRGRRVLELGAGLGLPSLAAALRGADVLATDWAEDAVALLRANAERNHVRLRAERARWDEPERFGTGWDVVLAADVLYEQRNADQLLELLPRLEAAEILLAEPGRPFAKPFFAAWGDVDEVGERLYRLR